MGPKWGGGRNLFILVQTRAYFSLISLNQFSLVEGKGGWVGGLRTAGVENKLGGKWRNRLDYL